MKSTDQKNTLSSWQSKIHTSLQARRPENKLPNLKNTGG